MLRKITIALASLALAFTATTACATEDSTTDTKSVSDSSPESASGHDSADSGPRYQEPTKKDFKLTVKILTKECFGSAGCNVSYRIKLAYLGTGELDPDKSYDLTYKVRGGDDPQLNTLTVSGNSYTYDEEEFISTPSSESKLTAVVADVEEH